MGLGGHLAVFELHPLFQGVQAGDPEGLLAHVDAGHLGAASGHALGEDAATAADVEHALAKQTAALLGDPVKAHRIDLMQGFELALHVPPAGGDGFKFGDFCQIDIGITVHFSMILWQGAQRAGRAQSIVLAGIITDGLGHTSPTCYPDLWLKVFGSVCYHVALFKPKNN
ncbi:hypothetical protein D3C81_638390 [compost metagenome]